ncbi:MAG: DUF2007 domain-containing protein [Bacteroidales bacterium]|nr:DUF2007 domain-containing protein [Bacteroidales bacterium]
MTNLNLKSVYVGTTINANYLKSVLNDNEIDCILRDFLQEGAHAGFGGASFEDAAEVFVNETDFEKAKELATSLFE